MIELRTLGAIDLRHTDGTPIQAVLAQPRRLALLVYLAKAGLNWRRRSIGATRCSRSSGLTQQTDVRVMR